METKQGRHDCGGTYGLSGGSSPDSITVAGVDDLDGLLAAVGRTRFVVSPVRWWTEADARAYWLKKVRARYAAMMGKPTVEILLEWHDGAVRSWVILKHKTEESSSGLPQSMILPPVYVATPSLLAEAARRSREQGAVIVVADLAAEDTELSTVFTDAGFVAEARRIVLRLDVPAADALLSAPIKQAACVVREADTSDSLNFMLLSTECVPMMFHERRRPHMAEIEMRFFQSFAGADFSPGSPHQGFIAETGDGELMGGILTTPKCEKLLDGSWEAYLNDMAVLPQYWGKATGTILTAQALGTLKRAGIRSVAADISTDNHRIMSVAKRVGAATERLHYVLLLNEEEFHDGR